VTDRFEAHPTLARAAAQATIAGLVVAVVLGYLSWVDTRRTEFFSQRTDCEHTLTELDTQLTERSILAYAISDKTVSDISFAAVPLLENRAATAGLWSEVQVTCLRNRFLSKHDSFGRLLPAAMDRSMASTMLERDFRETDDISGSARRAVEAHEWVTGAIGQVQAAAPPTLWNPFRHIESRNDFKMGCRYIYLDLDAKPDCSFRND
jgi:hypothetical protein